MKDITIALIELIGKIRLPRVTSVPPKVTSTEQPKQQNTSKIETKDETVASDPAPLDLNECTYDKAVYRKIEFILNTSKQAEELGIQGLVVEKNLIIDKIFTQELLKSTCQKHSHYPTGMSILAYAAIQNVIPLVALLAQHNFVVTHLNQSDYYMDPLQAVCVHGTDLDMSTMCRYLLDKSLCLPIDTEYKDDDHSTCNRSARACYFAARYRDQNTVMQLLLSNPNLGLAIKIGADTETLTAYLKKCKELTDNGIKAAFTAYEHLTAAKALQKSRAAAITAKANDAYDAHPYFTISYLAAQLEKFCKQLEKQQPIQPEERIFTRIIMIAIATTLYLENSQRNNVSEDKSYEQAKQQSDRLEDYFQTEILEPMTRGKIGSKTGVFLFETVEEEQTYLRFLPRYAEIQRTHSQLKGLSEEQKPLDEAPTAAPTSRLRSTSISLLATHSITNSSHRASLSPMPSTGQTPSSTDDAQANQLTALRQNKLNS